jgi:hypothetical protein
VLLVVAAVLVALQDGTRWYYSGVLHPTVIGLFWDRVLALAHTNDTAMQHRMPPWLWDNVIVYLPQLWVAPTLAAPGLILLWQTRPRTRRGTRLD